MLLALLPTAFAMCTAEQRSQAALDRAVATAEQAIDALDPDSLQGATHNLIEALRCRTHPITVAHAADLHRLLGIEAFVLGRERESGLWFGASRALDPVASLGHTIGGPIESAWRRAAPTTPPLRTDLARARDGQILIDGQPLDSHPTYLPFVIQIISNGDTVLSHVVDPGQTVPVYSSKGRPPEASRRKSKGWTVAAGSVALASTGALTAAALTRTRYKNPDRSEEDVAKLIPLNRTLGGVGYGLVVASVGLGTIAVVSGEW